MNDCTTEMSIYWTGVLLSLVITCAVLIYRNTQRNFDNNPEHGRKFWAIMAATKVVLGMLLLTVLYPSDCNGYESHYGVVVVGIGLYWMALAAVTRTDASGDVTSEMPPMGSKAVSKEII